MRPLPLFLAAGLLASAVAPGVAHAKAAKKKASASSPAAQLLAEGRKLMAANNFAEACPKIADSQSQAPAPATAMTLAECYEKGGKLASAWTAYRTATDSAFAAGKNKLAEEAKKKTSALEPKLSRLTIRVKGSGVDVKCDGDVVQETDYGNAIPRDGGGHDVEASAAGKKTWKKHVDLAESGQTLEVDVPPLENQGAAPVAGSASTASAPAAAIAEAPPATGSSTGDGQRIAGIAVGGVGVVGIVVGAVAGLHAKSTYDQALAACGGTPACGDSTDGLSLRASAAHWATLSTASFIVGGAAIAGGVVLFFTAPHAREAQGAALGIAPASQGTGLSLVGRF